jgi:hypothetical protein
MPNDLFTGKSNVQTNIYVFRVGERHQNDDIVKFIDFSNDGYTRSSRKKSVNNLKDTDNAKERYQELVDLSLIYKDFISGITKSKQKKGVAHEIGSCGDYEFNAMTVVREIKQMV